MLLDNINEWLEIVDDGHKVVNRISGALAYRKYHWLRDLPITNMSGNFRGMVIDARWGVVYKVSSTVGDAASNLALLASIAVEARRAGSDIDRILKSDEPWEVKGAKLSLQVSGICTRVLLDLLTGTVNATTWVMRHTAWLNPIFWLDRQEFRHTMDTMDRLMQQVTSSWQRFTSGDRAYHVINTVING